MADLNFQPAPQQPYQSDVLALLQGLAGLGLNIAGAVTKTGAVGNSSVAASQAQLQQGVENQRELQKVQAGEAQANALYRQAQAMNMPIQRLNAVKAFGEGRDVNNMQQEIRNYESLLRDKSQDDKINAAALAAELQLQETAARESATTSPDRHDYYLKTQLIPKLARRGGANLGVSNIEVELLGLKDEKGHKLFDAKEAKKRSRELYEVLRQPGFFEFYKDKKPEALNDRFAPDTTAYEGHVANAKTLASLRAQLKDAKNLPKVQQQYLQMLSGAPPAGDEEKRRQELLKEFNGSK